MGVPHLFRHFARKCPGAIRVIDASAAIPPAPLASLYIDFNGVAHTCARSVIEGAPDGAPPPPDVEAGIVDACVRHLEYLIERFQRPGFVFVAVDGVPPRAKMHQQRSRRFSSAVRSPPSQSPSPSPSRQWHSNAITPGTAFMAALNAGLHRYAAERAGVTVTVSGSDEPGEGEQKIFEQLRRRRMQPEQQQEAAVVFGLDADLLLMAMAHVASAGGAGGRLLVGREQDLRGPMQLVDASALARHAAAEITRARGPTATNSHPMTQEDCVAEYVGVMSLLGNDFIPAMPGLSIRYGGVEAVVRVYGAVMSRMSADACGLMRGGPDALGGYDLRVLAAIAEELAVNEEDAIAAAERRQQHGTINNNNNNNNNNAQHALVRPGDPGWRPRYYSTLFCLNGRGTVPPDAVDAICVQYAITAAWSAQYLARGRCLSAGWHYAHIYAPTAADLCRALMKSSRDAVVRQTKSMLQNAEDDYEAARVGAGIDAAEWHQLLVLPPQSADLVPNPRVRALMTDPAAGCTHMFPWGFRTACYLKENLHEWVPVLPPPDCLLLSSALRRKSGTAA